MSIDDVTTTNAAHDPAPRGRQSRGATLQYVRFAVHETPYCVWTWDLDAENERFLSSVDPRYFMYIGKTHGAELTGAVAQHAAAALRIAYGHGLESMFSLLCAAFQAPGCVAGWMTRYRNEELDALVAKISAGKPFYSRLPLDAPGWDGLAAEMFRHTNPSARTPQLARRFAEVWGRFAADFLDDQYRREYNSIKHGLRARMGGFQIAIGLRNDPAGPVESMQSLGSSEFGSSFFVPKSLGDKLNISLDHHALNWNPECIVHALELISLTMANTLAMLRVRLRLKKSDARFWVPSDDSHFDRPWRPFNAPVAFSFSHNIELEPSELQSRSDILGVYDRREP